MTSNIEQRLHEMEITLPSAAAPAANYVPFLINGNLLYVSGQLPIKNGEVMFKGEVSTDLSVEEAITAAKLCAINILAQAKAALGDLNKLEQCIKLGGFVASPAGFTDHPKVINGASDLMVDALGDKGKHTRFAVGASSLPLGASVEIDALFAIST